MFRTLVFVSLLSLVMAAPAFPQAININFGLIGQGPSASYAAGRRLGYGLYSRISKPALRSIR